MHLPDRCLPDDRERRGDRPLIGLCAALERARWGVWDQTALLLPRSYVDAVQGAGALALLLPPDPAVQQDPEQLLCMLDGVLLAGGADIDPRFYGQTAHPMTERGAPSRDAFEIALAQAAIAADIPVLGICRGMQLLNVALGGSLLQHLPALHGHDVHLAVAGTFEGADHLVELAPGSLAARAAGEIRHVAKSHHHQGVDRIGEGLVVTGTAPIDGLPEALELPGKRFVLGVQWHPEVDPGSEVIRAFVDAASQRRRARSCSEHAPTDERSTPIPTAARLIDGR